MQPDRCNADESGKVDCGMDSRTGLAAALAAIALAAGIESAGAVEYVTDNETGLARIEASTSADELRDQLHALLSTNPADPMVGTLTRHIIRLAQVTTVVERNIATDAISNDFGDTPY